MIPASSPHCGDPRLCTPANKNSTLSISFTSSTFIASQVAVTRGIVYFDIVSEEINKTGSFQLYYLSVETPHNHIN